MEHGISRLLRPDLTVLPKIIKETDKHPEPWIGYMESDTYHGDKERISSSGVREILKSPRKFLQMWLEGDTDEDQEADHFRFGRAAHLFILEPEKFRQVYVVEPEFTAFTKQGKPTKSANAEGVSRRS